MAACDTVVADVLTTAQSGEIAFRLIRARIALRIGFLVINAARFAKEINIRNKLSRSTFTAAYLLLCLLAIGVQVIHLHD